MRIEKEKNIEVLRQKAMLLEQENLRLQRDYSKALREVLSLQGMLPEAVELNLPILLERTLNKLSISTRPGNENFIPDKNEKGAEKPIQKGHGPTAQKEVKVEQCTFDLDEPDKVCTECGGDLQEWENGADKIEVIDIVERHFVIKQCTLKKYRCKCGGCIETAEGPQKLIKGGRYSSDVAIAVAVAKYMDHLPLSRQAKMAKRQGLDITSQTLWDQIWAIAVLLGPLCERIRLHILNQSVIGTDLTSFKLIGKGGSKNQQVWQLSCPEAIWFDIKPSKKMSVGRELFLRNGEPYQGIVMADGAAELAALSRELAFILVACMSHARRAVLKADGEAPGQVRQFLEMVGRLYAVEKEAAREPDEDDPRMGYRHLLDMEKLRELRDTKSRAICDEIKAWILEQSCIPGGALKKGLDYVASRWTDLTRFLDDPRIPLDNNLTERHFIGLAIGRRNYVGARSERGLVAAANFYTIVESARACGIDGEAYLRDVVDATLNKRDVLLPHKWRATHR